jgi:DNA-binding FrmR family transcriptional regulator
MIDDDAYCIDVLQQVSAVRRALDKLALILLRDHLETCVTDAIAERKPEEKINELIGAIDRFLA